MKYGFVYETTNKINGMKYIGKHKRSQDINDPDDSWYLGSGDLISLAISKYGSDNFSRVRLCEATSEEELSSLEEYYLNKVNASENPLYYNIINRSGGGALTGESLEKMRRSLTGRKDTEEVRLHKKMSANRESTKMLKSKIFKGRRLSEETKLKISESVSKTLKGRNFSEEHKRNLSDSKKQSGVWKGENNPQYNKDHSGENNYFYGRKHTEETKEHLSSIRKERFSGENHPLYGKQRSQESKDKISASLKGRVLPEEVKEKMKVAASERCLTKVCLNCGSVYTTKGTRSKYCCLECKYEYYKRGNS